MQLTRKVVNPGGYRALVCQVTRDAAFILSPRSPNEGGVKYETVLWSVASSFECPN